MRNALNQALRRWAEKDGRGYPDWATRYGPILRRIGRGTLPGKRILEIGANENGFARFSGAPLIAVDIAVAHLKAARKTEGVTPVCADIAHLPFSDGAMDLVLCVDTFEHLPEPVRGAAIREILRSLAAEGRGLIAFPEGAAAAAAEQRVAAAYRGLTGESIQWLEEHAACGLPDGAALLDAVAAEAGERFVIHQEGNTTLWLWEWMWRVLMCNWPGRANALFQALLRFLTPLLSRLHWGPCYRRFIWISGRKR